MGITNNRLRWLIDINVFMTPISHINFNTNTVDALAVRQGYRTSSGAQNDEISFDLVLAKGTWSIETMYFKNTDSGIISVQIDGAQQGTIDTYAAALSRNNRSTISGIVISQAGKHRLTLKMTAKNASSTNYYGRIQHIQARRTA